MPLPCTSARVVLALPTGVVWVVIGDLPGNPPFPLEASNQCSRRVYDGGCQRSCHFCDGVTAPRAGHLHRGGAQRARGSGRLPSADGGGECAAWSVRGRAGRGHQRRPRSVPTPGPAHLKPRSESPWQFPGAPGRRAVTVHGRPRARAPALTRTDLSPGRRPGARVGGRPSPSLIVFRRGAPVPPWPLSPAEGTPPGAGGCLGLGRAHHTSWDAGSMGRPLLLACVARGRGPRGLAAGTAARKSEHCFGAGTRGTLGRGS